MKSTAMKNTDSPNTKSRGRSLVFSLHLTVYILVAVCHIIYISTPYWVNISSRNDNWQHPKSAGKNNLTNIADIGIAFVKTHMETAIVFGTDAMSTTSNSDSPSSLFTGGGNENTPMANIMSAALQLPQIATNNHLRFAAVRDASLLLVAVSITMSLFCIIIMVLKEYHPSVSGAVSKTNDRIVMVISLLLVAMAFTLIGLQLTAVHIQNVTLNMITAKVGANIILPSLSILFLFGSSIIHYLTCTEQIINVFDDEEPNAVAPALAPQSDTEILATNTMLPSVISV